MPQSHQSDPDLYEGSLSEEASDQRSNLEKRLANAYETLPTLSGMEKLRAGVTINHMEQQLAWQGANPKAVDIHEWSEHVEASHDGDAISAKYRAAIKNRATGIRAFCVDCQGGSVAGIASCAAVTCPLHPFRMGKDPLRGWDIPKVEMPELEDDDDMDEFEDGDSGNEKDARL